MTLRRKNQRDLQGAIKEIWKQFANLEYREMEIRCLYRKKKEIAAINRILGPLRFQSKEE